MSDKGRHEGKVAFVTGAGSGIGRATPLAFAYEDANLVAVDRDEQSASDTVRQISEQGGTAIAVRCNVTSSDQIQAALARSVEAFGRIDIAFNNAGIEPSPSTVKRSAGPGEG